MTRKYTTKAGECTKLPENVPNDQKIYPIGHIIYQGDVK
jgi:hypothetical protein